MIARREVLSDFNRREWLSIGGAALGGLLPLSAAGKQDIQRIRLSLNENPFGPSPLAIQAIKADLADLSRYAGDEIGALTSTIAEREEVAPSQVVLGEILDVLGLYLAADGDRDREFIYSEPGYTALVNAVAPAGGIVVAVPLNKRLENDLSAIERKVNERTKAVYLVNPHNPTGTVTEAGKFIDFVQELSKRTLVIVDEAYLEFTPEFEKRTVASLTRNGARVLVFRTFSKIYGLAGLAIGYALAPRDFAAAIKQLGIGAFYGLNRLGLVAANASLKDASYVTSVRAKVSAERDAWHDLFRLRKIHFAESHGNFVFFDSGQPQQIMGAALTAQGIDIGRAYPPLDTWVRISIGLPDENAVARRAVAALLPSP